MSTISRIKGSIDNPNLPVLTSSGLQSYYYGSYLTAIESTGYTLTSNQASAIKDFVDGVVDNGLTDYVHTVFPFVGNSSFQDAVKVPIFGEKLFDFEDSFDGIEYNESNYAKGITKTPAVSELSMEDVQPNKNVIGMAMSCIKASGTASDQERVFNFNYRFMIRYKDGKYGFYARKNGELDYITINDNINKSAAGPVYVLGAFGEGRYVRHVEFGGNVNNAGSTWNVPLEATAEDLASTLSASTWPVTNLVTSITFMKKVMSKAQASMYVGLLKNLMIALGRDS